MSLPSRGLEIGRSHSVLLTRRRYNISVTNVLFSVLKILGGSRLEALPCLDRVTRLRDGFGLLVLKPVEWL